MTSLENKTKEAKIRSKIPKKEYKKPTYELQTNMTFMYDTLQSNESQYTCKQCSSCHGCR